MAESSRRSKRRNTSSNFCILRSCSHVAWFIVPHFLTGTQNRTTRVLPNPDNSLAYDNPAPTRLPVGGRTGIMQLLFGSNEFRVSPRRRETNCPRPWPAKFWYL